MANFLSKFSHFRYHGNGGLSDVNFNVAVKLPDLKNPLFGATSLALSLVLTQF